MPETSLLRRQSSRDVLKKSGGGSRFKRQFSKDVEERLVKNQLVNADAIQVGPLEGKCLGQICDLKELVLISI